MNIRNCIDKFKHSMDVMFHSQRIDRRTQSATGGWRRQNMPWTCYANSPNYPCL